MYVCVCVCVCVYVGFLGWLIKMDEEGTSLFYNSQK